MPQHSPTEPARKPAAAPAPMPVAVPEPARRRKVRTAAIAAACVLAAIVLIGAAAWWHFAPSEQASARYPRELSSVDFNGNGTDDYTDFLAGARAEAEAHPAYDGGYYAGGYPPEDRGACTDTVWRAFRAAGFDLKAMVDADIAADPEAYAQVASPPDPNIDFRRARVLDVFFSRYARPLTCDTADYAAWQAGDIVVFENGRHIGIVSDARDARGTAFLIHNSGQPFREENYLAYPWHQQVTSHYRFDASRIPPEVLRAWQ